MTLEYLAICGVAWVALDVALAIVVVLLMRKAPLDETHTD